MPAKCLRRSTPEDIPALELLYPAAFPGEDLLPLVRSLLDGAAPVLSLTWVEGARPVGHAVFTFCEVAPAGTRVALTGPVAVLPARQKAGIGQSLIEAGIRDLDADGVSHAFVLGDPAYYARFGFLPDRLVATPCPLPKDWRDAWQRLDMRGATPPQPGRLVAPSPWMAPALWSDTADAPGKAG